MSGATQENGKANAQKPELLDSLQTRGFMEQKSCVIMSKGLGLWISLLGPWLGKKLIFIFQSSAFLLAGVTSSGFREMVA